MPNGEKTYNLYRWATIETGIQSHHMTLERDYRGGKITQIYNEAGRREVTVVVRHQDAPTSYRFLANSLFGEIDRVIKSAVAPAGADLSV